MKRNFNVIQINGIKGIIFAAGIVSCLIAGFVAFPGLVMKLIWNVIASYTGVLPEIAIVQGILLWGIVVVAYLAFRKRGFMVEFKSADDLSTEEMEAVMQRIRVERQSDILAKALMRAKEAEEKAKQEQTKDGHNIKNS